MPDEVHHGSGARGLAEAMWRRIRFLDFMDCPFYQSEGHLERQGQPLSRDFTTEATES